MRRSQPSDVSPAQSLWRRPMYQWLCEALRAWFVPLPPCRRDPPEQGLSLPRSRKRRQRHRSTLLQVEDSYQECTKRQKLVRAATWLYMCNDITYMNAADPVQEEAYNGGKEIVERAGIVGTLTQGIATLITLPSQLTARYLQSGDQHAAATDEAIPSVSGTLAASKMEPPSAMQVSELEKRAISNTTPHRAEEKMSTCHSSMAFLRSDYSVKKSNKKNHNSVQSGLLPGRLSIHSHLLEPSILDSGRNLRKPHFTVEEGVQREERERYKRLLEQEKGRSSKNHSASTIKNHLDGKGYTHGLQNTNRYMEGDNTSFQTLKNGIRNFVPLPSKRNANSSMTVSERSSEPERLQVRKKEVATIKWPLASDLSEEVSLRLSLGQEGSSRRRRSLVEKNKQKCLSLEKAAECLPELTQDMEREVATALNYGREDEILTSAFKLNVTRGDIQTLKNQQLLNDVVINFYMNLLVERNKRLGLPVLYTFNTFFYTKLNSEGYSAVKRWTKGVDLFQHDIILVPIHIQVHWALVVMDMRRETIKYFDSMGQNGHAICKRLLQFLQEESQAKRSLDINVSAWTLYSVEPHEIPQQLNDSDCGMFVCKYADFISRDRPVAFTQRHIPYFRKKMVWEILHHQLL